MLCLSGSAQVEHIFCLRSSRTALPMATSEDAKRKREDEAEVEAKKLCTSCLGDGDQVEPSQLQRGYGHNWDVIRLLGYYL